MAGAAVLGRLTWLVADVVDLVQESATARSVVLDVPGWPGHLAGQHVDIRVTAPDGYSARRSSELPGKPTDRSARKHGSVGFAGPSPAVRPFAAFETEPRDAV